uniref:Uncharacterized protein n=2 Tax=gambiae species complex TaxID=44542 RepID=A0A182VC49_ANOME
MKSAYIGILNVSIEEELSVSVRSFASSTTPPSSWSPWQACMKNSFGLPASDGQWLAVKYVQIVSSLYWQSLAYRSRSFRSLNTCTSKSRPLSEAVRFSQSTFVPARDRSCGTSKFSWLKMSASPRRLWFML